MTGFEIVFYRLPPAKGVADWLTGLECKRINPSFGRRFKSCPRYHQNVTFKRKSDLF